MFKDGFSIQKIADKLNDMGVLSPLDYKFSIGVHIETPFKLNEVAKWEYNTVKRILKNEVYIGVMAQGKTGRPNYKIRVIKNKSEEDWIKIENTHEALVSFDDFMAIREMMNRETRSNNDETNSILGGFLFCADCGSSMIRKIVPSKNKKYLYYTCSAHKKFKNCSTHCISAKEVTERVLSAIHDQVDLVINLEKALMLIENSPNYEKNVFSYENQIIKLEEEIEKYRNLKKNLYEDLKDEIITKSEYLDFRSSYTNAIDEKSEAIKRLKKDIEQAKNTGTTTKNWVTIFKEYENVDELNRRVLMALVDKIKIHENHSISISFKYGDEYVNTLEYVSRFTDIVNANEKLNMVNEVVCYG